MKNLITLTLLLLTISSFAQEKSDHLFTIGDNKIGFYIGTSAKYSTLNPDPVGYLEIKGAFVINGKWVIGVSATGLYYDKKLSSLVNDGTYLLNVGYSTFFVERIFSFNENFKTVLSVQSGYGTAYYRYDKDYRKNKTWSNEIIDLTDFYVLEPGIEIEHRLSGNFWIGVTASLRNTSPVELIGSSDKMMNKLNTGISLKWGMF